MTTHRGVDPVLQAADLQAQYATLMTEYRAAYAAEVWR